MPHASAQDQTFMEELRRRVRHALPDWAEVEIRNGQFVIAAHGRVLATVLGPQGRVAEPRTGDYTAEVFTAMNFLDTLQDVLVRESGDSWPSSSGLPTELATPSVLLEGTRLRLSYGPLDAPILAMEPVDLK